MSGLSADYPDNRAAPCAGGSGFFVIRIEYGGLRKAQVQEVFLHGGVAAEMQGEMAA